MYSYLYFIAIVVQYFYFYLSSITIISLLYWTEYPINVMFNSVYMVHGMLNIKSCIGYFR